MSTLLWWLKAEVHEFVFVMVASYFFFSGFALLGVWRCAARKATWQVLSFWTLAHFLCGSINTYRTSNKLHGVPILSPGLREKLGCSMPG